MAEVIVSNLVNDTDEDLMMDGVRHTLNLHDWTKVVTGSGSTPDTPPTEYGVASGATIGSTSLMRHNSAGWTHSIGVAHNVIDFDVRFVIHTTVRARGTTNGVARFSIGKSDADGIGALANKGFGFRLNNMGLTGFAHDGADLTTVDLSTTFVTDIVRDIVMVLDGLGTIGFFVDGVEQGSLPGGPVGDSVAADTMIQLEADNGPDAANQGLFTGLIEVYVAR